MVTESIKPGYKQTEIGIIPDDWDVFNIDEISEVKSGKRLPKGRKLLDSQTSYPYIRVSDMYLGGVSLSEIKYVPIDVYPSIKNYRIFKEDIFISVAGTLGIVGIIPKQLDGANLTENADRLTNISCNRDFLVFILMSPIIQSVIESESTLGAQPKLALTRIRKFKIPLPKEQEEQQTIAQVLSDTNVLIQQLDKLILKKKDIKKGAMQELLTGKKRLPGFSREWEDYTIDLLCKSFTKQTGFDYSAYIKPKLVSTFKKGTISFIQNKDFKAKHINFNTDYYIPEDVAIDFPRILLDEKCLLISISGSIGNVGIFCNSRKAFIGGAIAVAKFRNKNQLDWVMYYLLSNIGQNKLLNKVKAGSHQNLILEDIRNITIPMPSDKEQQALTNILSDMDVEIKELEQKRDKYKMIKEGMMQQLLTGKIRIKWT